MVDGGDAKLVGGTARVPDARVDEARGEPGEVRALDEAERDVAERRRNLEGAVASTPLVGHVDGVAQESPAALVEERHRVIEVKDPEAQAHDPVGVSAQIARRLRLLRQGRRHAHAHIACSEDDRLLTAALGELGARPRDLLEAKPPRVEVTGPFQVLDDEVKRVVSGDADAALASSGLQPWPRVCHEAEP